MEELDRWISEGRFSSRSEAIKTIVALYRAGTYQEVLSDSPQEERRSEKAPRISDSARGDWLSFRALLHPGSKIVKETPSFVRGRILASMRSSNGPKRKALPTLFFRIPQS